MNERLKILAAAKFFFTLENALHIEGQGSLRL